MLTSGDVIALLPMYESVGSPYALHIQLLEADRMGTPDSNGESTSKDADGGNARIVDGVEVGKRHGARSCVSLFQQTSIE